MSHEIAFIKKKKKKKAEEEEQKSFKIENDLVHQYQESKKLFHYR